MGRSLSLQKRHASALRPLTAVIPADTVRPVIIVVSIVILAVALGLFVLLLRDESASSPTAPTDDL